MYPITKRHDDIVVQRRIVEDTATHLVRQVYAVTYPQHDDRGAEQPTYAKAEVVALERAERGGVSAWYQETPNSLRIVLLGSFRFKAAAAVGDSTS